MCIRTLLMFPNSDDPMEPEIGFLMKRNMDEYLRRARARTEKYAMWEHAQQASTERSEERYFVVWTGAKDNTRLCYPLLCSSCLCMGAI